MDNLHSIREALVSILTNILPDNLGQRFECGQFEPVGELECVDIKCPLDAKKGGTGYFLIPAPLF